MHIVLIEHGGERILDAPDVVKLQSIGLHRSEHRRESADALALKAARQFDEREGRFYWDYRFTPFGPRDRKDGYDVFICRHERDATTEERLQDFGVVVTECFYAGYVRRLPPAILIDCRERRSSDAHVDCLFPVNVWA
ncbi:hypothetical protein AMST5_02448 [freshwater sediment metagenome]|uniref:Uncharacterized protein n=1 Tax=freshwater sediment metagenome TaxID=556182 RepID=A0AA48M3F3_9ZZZZ